MGNKTKNLLALSPNSLIMGMILAFVGGFLDAYTYITRDAVFATAQTGNMVLTVPFLIYRPTNWKNGVTIQP